MNSRRGSTSSPMRIENVRSASAANLMPCSGALLMAAAIAPCGTHCLLCDIDKRAECVIHRPFGGKRCGDPRFQQHEVVTCTIRLQVFSSNAPFEVSTAILGTKPVMLNPLHRFFSRV